MASPARVGTSFEFSPALVGEVALGYLLRGYKDPTPAGRERAHRRRVAGVAADRPDHRKAHRRDDD